MTFTKKKMAAVISGSLLMGLASTAGATVDLDLNTDTNAANDTDVTIASELTVAATGQAIDDTGTAGFLDVTAVLNPSVIPANSDVRVTATLGGTATFSSTIPTAAVGAITFGVIAGGTGTNSVTWNANVGTADLAASQTLNLTIDEITVTDQSDVSMTVTIQRADNFGTASVKEITSSPYLEFADSYAVTYAPNTSVDSIDVTNNSIIFTGTDNASTAQADAGTVTVAYTGSNDFTGAAVAQTNITNAIVATVTGSNGLDAFGSTNGGSVTFGAIGTTVTGTDAATSAQTAAAMTAAHLVNFAIPATNAVEIQETPVTVTLAATPGAGYNANSLNGSGSLSDLAKNGSQARLTFALTPGGSYPNFIRVTNPSNIAGDVQLMLTNDDGDTSTPIGIGSIEGQTGDSLAAGASTALLNMQAVYDAVTAADSTFMLGANSDKLRVNVTAEFGAAGSTGVVLSSFSLSTDGNTFNMMTDASN